jgi:hypothetical protein
LLHVSAEEQPKRLREPIEHPGKHWTIETDDIHNFSRRRDDVVAMDDACADLDQDASRHVIAAERKWFARVTAIGAAVAILGDGLEFGPLPVDRSRENRPQATGEQGGGRARFCCAQDEMSVAVKPGMGRV